MKNKVLLSAFACDPSMGSEPYVGWNWLLQTLKASDEFDVILLTRRMHETSVRDAMSPEDSNRLTIIAFDLFGLSGMDHRHRLMKLYFVFWQFAALFYVGAYQLRNRSIRVIHHCTYNVVDMPGFLWLIPGSGFIWGPVGGGQVPPAWARRIYGDGWRREQKRRFMKKMIRYNPLVYLASMRASKIYVANDDTHDVLPTVAKPKCIRLMETAVNHAPSPQPRTDASNLKFNILWVGQLEARKALIILLDAMVYLRQHYPAVFRGLSVKIVGSGPDELAMILALENANLGQVVDLAGALPYAEVQRLYQEANAFVFTSVQDTSGNVLLEALSNGIPCIAFNHQGAKEILHGGGGMLLNVNSYDEAVCQLAEGLKTLATSPELVNKLSSDAVANINKGFLWEQKGIIQRKVLNEILNGTASFESRS